MSEADFRSRAKLNAKGHRYEDMTEGRVFEHHWGRTLTAGDNAAFQSLFFVGLLLFVVTLILNVVGDAFVRRVRQAY